ncbi:AspC5 [Desulforapulum autotrophicum HRM2]|uniref:Aminotransferase n=1 Tax=Desulforapulum autotrophicum (strain ATCC 43914 / DSM 3382 / VKM B-1955 / HRM2) TaxID=177437 RepID=C0QDS2_DESAH|nr:aminotransferase class I/II-fold pyridoxal phosphate-dependent enzyme [Desulforapulum autotrophicum]ACN17343.1 AspC5 [Desulforapulum autotrophicum HRM2]
MHTLKISQSVQDLRYSVIREMGGMAAHMDDVITLGIGEPDFDTPGTIIEKAFEDARNGHTHYTQSQGDPELLERLAQVATAGTGIRVTPSSVLVTHGGMGALTAALRTLLEQGDHVLLVEPHFPDYMAHIAFAGGIAVKVQSRFENGFIPLPEDLEKAITTKTRVLILNSPNNPTGAVIPGHILDAIADIAIRHNLFVISDEVYDTIVYDRPFESIYTRPEMADRTLVIKSFSKSHAMTGWRIGYCFGPQAMMDQMLKVVNYSTACASSIGQRAALAALDIDPSILEQMKNRFAARVDLVCARLNAMDNIQVTKPGGSFYVFADISRITRQSRQFAIQLLNSKRVVVVPGYAFGESGEGCIRIACTRNRHLLDTAMDRIQSFLDDFQKR